MALQRYVIIVATAFGGAWTMLLSGLSLTDYGKRPMRWINATRARFTKELSTSQKVRFLARIGVRSLDHHPQND